METVKHSWSLRRGVLESVSGKHWISAASVWSFVTKGVRHALQTHWSSYLNHSESPFMGKITSTHCPCLRYYYNKLGSNPTAENLSSLCVPHLFSTSFFPQAGYQLYAVFSLLLGITSYLYAYLQEHVVLCWMLVNTEQSIFRIWELPAVIAHCSYSGLADGGVLWGSQNCSPQAVTCTTYG